MKIARHMKKKLSFSIIWLLEGILVGFGAILPGVSGGTLCVVFGMYRPAVETMARPLEGIKKHGFMLGIFLVGAALGFVGLSGLAAWLMEKNLVLVTCVFAGFILGTIPGLWQEAGDQGRPVSACVAGIACFILMSGVLFLLKTERQAVILPGFAGFLLCGLCWGLSFVVPGLSSSSLLLFFGLYQPMLEGISGLDPRVLFPMGLGVSFCVLLLAKLAERAYNTHYAVISHGVLGIVTATALMILPVWDGRLSTAAVNGACILGGAMISSGFFRWSEWIKGPDPGKKV